MSSPSAGAGTGWLAWTGAAGVVAIDVKKFRMPRPSSASALHALVPSSPTDRHWWPLRQPVVGFFASGSCMCHKQLCRNVGGMLALYQSPQQLLWFGGETSALVHRETHQAEPRTFRMFQSSFPRIVPKRKVRSKVRSLCGQQTFRQDPIHVLLVSGDL